MHILIVGSGGREHALAWKAAQSPRVAQLYIAPGNAGTARVAQNVAISADDTAALVAFAREKKVDLVIVGPEVPLANGVGDALRAAGIRVFGPSRAAAQIESSKTFAKAFMARHHIPTARYAAFTEFDSARDFLRAADFPAVIKASGLAAGKGVIVPASLAEAEDALRRILVAREFGAAGDEVVIEEKLEGEEVSLIAFTDGVTVKPMPPAQDHKRLLDDDRGPNTGGMGAYAPAPICPPALVAEFARTILQPTVDGLRAEGTPFVGALFAGLMLARDGARVLEFNCRFGDPETQVLMPLLVSDLIEIADACTAGQLSQVEVKWKTGAAACVVIAAGGYPDKPKAGDMINGLDAPLTDATVFHAGTKTRGDEIVTAGGRVLGITGWDDSLRGALARAYAAVAPIVFDGMQYRRDIGAKGLQP
jgi:phosphoribosylamine--glycine ligase